MLWLNHRHTQRDLDRIVQYMASIGRQNDLIVIDPLAPYQSASYDPFRAPDPVDAGTCLAAIFPPAANGAHLDRRDALTALICSHRDLRVEITLERLSSVLAGDLRAEYLVLDYPGSTPDEDPAALAEMAGRFLLLSNSGVVARAKGKAGRLDIFDAVAHGKVVYCALPVGRSDTNVTDVGRAMMSDLGNMIFSDCQIVRSRILSSLPNGSTLAGLFHLIYDPRHFNLYQAAPARFSWAWWRLLALQSPVLRQGPIYG